MCSGQVGEMKREGDNKVGCEEFGHKLFSFLFTCVEFNNDEIIILAFVFKGPIAIFVKMAKFQEIGTFPGGLESQIYSIPSF